MFMNWIALVLAATIAAAASLFAADEAAIHTAAGLQWGDGPARLPAGAKMTVLDGDPGKPGSFTVRLKLPAGYKIMPHTHPAAERVTVISGTLQIGMGDQLDHGAGRKLSAGDFVVFPKGSSHSAWTSEETVIQLQSEGPFDMDYANPADDPRAQKK
jgi:quercetin dioxygenase-like cupin family protein